MATIKPHPTTAIHVKHPTTGFPLHRKVELGILVPLPFSVLPEATFPQRLRKLRIQEGFGQRELAGAAGLSKDLIWRWESGLHGPSQRKLEAVASVFGVAVDRLASSPAGT